MVTLAVRWTLAARLLAVRVATFVTVAGEAVLETLVLRVRVPLEPLARVNGAAQLQVSSTWLVPQPPAVRPGREPGSSRRTSR